MLKYLILSLSLLSVSLPAMAQEPEEDFSTWLAGFKTQALEQGISPEVADKALGGLYADEQVIRLDRKQPESTKTFTQYLTGVVNSARIAQGRRLMVQHRDLLEKVSRDYGVQPAFIVALWGIETNFGGYTGNMSVINSLATLAWEGRRREFFTKELMNALQIVQEGHITASAMDGSWAGAMGQCQFMPSSFLSFAVDYNGNGRKNIWGELPDVFASIANYLKSSGWDDELTWGRAVKLPAGLDESLTDGKQYKPLSEWQKLGVRKADGSALPDRDVEAALTLPGKPHEQAYLIYSNYDVLLKWNRSRYFATAVGTLSDAIR
jgi:membrane-bound lytic murein transglycosylase B